MSKRQANSTGWRTWSRDSFETHNGPFWHRMDGRRPRSVAPSGFEQKHLNGMRNVHGGAFMAFADYCLFAIASPVLQGPGVTVSFGCEFLDAAREGELVEGTGEIIRAGGSMIFLRGLLKSGERPLFTFSGTIKRVKWRPPRRCEQRRRIEPAIFLPASCETRLKPRAPDAPPGPRTGRGRRCSP